MGSSFLLTGSKILLKVTLATPLRYYSDKPRNMTSTDLCVNVCIHFPSLPDEMGTVNYAQNFRKHGGNRILSFETIYWELQAKLDESDTLENKAFSKACEFIH